MRDPKVQTADVAHLHQFSLPIDCRPGNAHPGCRRQWSQSPRRSLSHSGRRNIRTPPGMFCSIVLCETGCPGSRGFSLLDAAECTRAALHAGVSPGICACSDGVSCCIRLRTCCGRTTQYILYPCCSIRPPVGHGLCLCLSHSMHGGGRVCKNLRAPVGCPVHGGFGVFYYK